MDFSTVACGRPMWLREDGTALPQAPRRSRFKKRNPEICRTALSIIQVSFEKPILKHLFEQNIWTLEFKNLDLSNISFSVINTWQLATPNDADAFPQFLAPHLTHSRHPLVNLIWVRHVMMVDPMHWEVLSSVLQYYSLSSKKWVDHFRVSHWRWPQCEKAKKMKGKIGYGKCKELFVCKDFWCDFRVNLTNI